MASVKARPADPNKAAQNAADLLAESNALDEYRGATQRYAFAVSLILSMLVTSRACGLSVRFSTATNSPAWRAPIRANTRFLCMDVALSATLLAGGADGVHSIVNAVTSFFYGSADKSSHPTSPA